MKAGIMTFPKSPSFGASLQMYALYKSITAFGVDTEVVNYVNEYMEKGSHISHKNTTVLKKIYKWITEANNRQLFAKFEKEIPMFPAKPIHSSAELKKVDDRYQYFVCGSDQVWNPDITGCDYSYLLDFCTDGQKKISYAPSFGVESLPTDIADKCATLLNDYSSLSVREEKGKELVMQLTGRDCPIVLDPTMLIERAQWQKEGKKKHGLPDHYVAYFIFNPKDYVMKYARNLSKQYSAPLLFIGGNDFTKLRHKEYSGSLGPREWLYIIEHADAVVTDSYHGAAFSIIFQKCLHVSLESSTKSRLVTLLKTFGIDKCAIPQGALDDRAYVEPDYNSVQRIMTKRRNESLDYLAAALNMKRI